MDVGNLISGSSAFYKYNLNIWKFSAHILLKTSLENFENYFASMWNECYCAVVGTFFGVALFWDWNEHWPFPVISTPSWLSRSWSSFLYSSSVYSWRKQWHPTPVLLHGKFHGQRSLVGCMQAMGVAKSRTQLSDFTFTFHFHALEKEMATHSSVLAWRIPGTGEPGGLLFMGSHRVGHDWSDLAVAVCVFLLPLDIFCFC